MSIAVDIIFAGKGHIMNPQRTPVKHVNRIDLTSQLPIIITICSVKAITEQMITVNMDLNSNSLTGFPGLINDQGTQVPGVIIIKVRE